MKINNLHISSFGKLQDIHISFVRDMNIYPGENEHGKSTILSFIRAMFYGFSQRGSSSARMKDNDRRRFIPWNGKAVGGSMEFEHEGKSYLLEKTFLKRKSDDTVSLTLLPSGRKIDLGQKEVGDYLFQISEAEFVNTVFVGQLSTNIMNTDKETEDVSARLANLAGTGTELFSHEEIKNRLTSAAAKLQALRGQGGLISRTEEELNRVTELEKQMDASQEQSDLLYGEIAVARENEKRLQAELSMIASTLENHRKQCDHLQTLLQEQEIHVQTELQRIRMEQEQETAKASLEKTNQEYLQQRESLRRQLSEELSAMESEILRLHKEKQEDMIRSDELAAGLDAMIHKQEDICKAANALHEKQISDTTYLEEEILTMSSEIKPLLQMRTEFQNGRTMIMGHAHPARRYVILILLAFIITVILYMLTRNLAPWIPVVFLLLAAGVFALNRFQLRSLDRRIVSLNTMHEAKMALFEASSALLFAAKDAAIVDDKRLEELTLQKARLREDTQKDTQHREYVLRLAKERRDTCMVRLEQFVDDPLHATQMNGEEGHSGEKIGEEIPAEAQKQTELDQTELDQTELDQTGKQMLEIRGQLSFLQKAISEESAREEGLRTQISTCRVEVARKETTRENLAAQTPDRSLLSEQKAMLMERIDTARTYHRALLTAQSVLDEAFSEMENVFAPQVNERAGAYLSKLTGGIYSDLHVDRSFSVELASDGEYAFHPIDYYSGGTVDQVYLALRLAISDLVQTSEDKMPLLLDDAFIQYDDMRAAFGLELLRELSLGRQIILFTCHRRMKDIYDASEAGKGK